METDNFSAVPYCFQVVLLSVPLSQRQPVHFPISLRTTKRSTGHTAFDSKSLRRNEQHHFRKKRQEAFSLKREGESDIILRVLITQFAVALSLKRVSM